MRELPDIEIRDATSADVEAILTVASSFFAYGGLDASDYCAETFRNTVEHVLSGGAIGCHTVVATHDGVVVGYYSVSYCALYTKRPMMYEAHFAVLPEYVRSHAGRKLTKAIIDFGEQINALAFYGGATSGIKRFDKSINNMYARCGFSSAGQVMRYKYG